MGFGVLLRAMQLCIKEGKARDLSGGMEGLKMCVFGGYDKLETLKYIDLLNSEIYLLESAIDKKKKGEEYVLPADVEERELRTSAIGGFDKEDTDRYIGELRAMISELREKLENEEPKI